MSHQVSSHCRELDGIGQTNTQWNMAKPCILESHLCSYYYNDSQQKYNILEYILPWNLRNQNSISQKKKEGMHKLPLNPFHVLPFLRFDKMWYRKERDAALHGKHVRGDSREGNGWLLDAMLTLHAWSSWTTACWPGLRKNKVPCHQGWHYHRKTIYIVVMMGWVCESSGFGHRGREWEIVHGSFLLAHRFNVGHADSAHPYINQ
jgi:hypothetical protein